MVLWKIFKNITIMKRIINFEISLFIFVIINIVYSCKADQIQLEDCNELLQFYRNGEDRLLEAKREMTVKELNCKDGVCQIQKETEIRRAGEVLFLEKETTNVEVIVNCNDSEKRLIYSLL